MTVTANSYTPLTYNGNGSTTVFSVTYQFYDLLVTHIDSSGSETVWVENTDFTVTGGAGSTGSITATTAPASGEQLRIERNTDKSQGEDYDLDNEVVEASLQSSVDKLAMIMQELIYNNDRRPAISIANYTGPVEFPAASTGSVLSWAADGNLANTALVDLDGVAISALTATASLENTDIFPLYDNSAGDNAGITWANLKTEIDSGITPEFADNVFRIQDNGDATKELAFEVSGIATGTTRTITVPNSNLTIIGKDTTDTLTNKTLTSPVLNTGVSGTAVLDEDDMSSDSATQLATQQSIKAYVDNNVRVAKAWANLNGTGTISLRGSFGISSVTDLGTGQYRFNFTTSLSSANYAVAVSGARALGSEGNVTLYGKNSSYVDIRTWSSGHSALVDYAYIEIVVFGD